MRFINEPSPLPVEAYFSAVDAYVRQIDSLAGLVSVSLMGSIGAPGLSDIDLIVVVEDQFEDSMSGLLSTTRMDRRLFLHGPVVVPRSLADELPYLIYATNLETVWGDRILGQYEGLRKHERKALALIYLVDFIESRFLQFSSVSKILDKRAWLTRIWSVTHSCNLFESVFPGGLGAEERNCLRDVKRTREGWEERGVVSDAVFRQALHSAKRLNESLFVRTLRGMYRSAELENPVVVVNGWKKMCFSNGLMEPVYKRRVLPFGRRSFGLTRARLPAEYLAHIVGYVPGLNINWKQSPIVDRSVRAVMAKRARVVTQHFDWVAAHASRSETMGGYLGVTLNRQRGVRERLREWITRMVA